MKYILVSFCIEYTLVGLYIILSENQKIPAEFSFLSSYFGIILNIVNVPYMIS